MDHKAIVDLLDHRARQVTQEATECQEIMAKKEQWDSRVREVHLEIQEETEKMAPPEILDQKAPLVYPEFPAPLEE